LVLPFWYWLTCPEKGPLNECVRVVVVAEEIWKNDLQHFKVLVSRMFLHVAQSLGEKSFSLHEQDNWCVWMPSVL